MSDYQHIELKIDRLFKTLIPPLSAEEYNQLEENLVHEGCREPICIWNGIIIDGHNRYDICLRNKIPFQIQRKQFQNKHEVIIWICANQIGRRNISEETRRYLIGKRYECEKVIGSHNASGKNQYSKGKNIDEVRTKTLVEPAVHTTESSTARKLGEEYRLSHATIAKYGAYSRAIDALIKKDEELVPRILSGQTKISQENLIELVKLPVQELKRLGKQLIENDRDFVGYAAAKKNLSPASPHKSTKKREPQEITVKDMPAFDPDAEILSLSLTIPSWISSIDRTQAAADIHLVSTHARENLIQMLGKLRETADRMLSMVGGEEYGSK